MLIEAIEGDALGLVTECRGSSVGESIGASDLDRIQNRGEIYRLIDERRPEILNFGTDQGVEAQPVTRPVQVEREVKVRIKGTTRWVIPDGGRLIQFHNSKS